MADQIETSKFPRTSNNERQGILQRGWGGLKRSVQHSLLGTPKDTKFIDPSETEKLPELSVRLPAFPILPAYIVGATEELQRVAEELGITPDQLNTTVYPEDPERTLASVYQTLRALTAEEPSQAFTHADPRQSGIELKPYASHADRRPDYLNQLRLKFVAALGTLLILLAACDQINEPSAGNTNVSQQPAITEVIPTAEATQLLQGEATTETQSGVLNLPRLRIENSSDNQDELERTEASMIADLTKLAELGIIFHSPDGTDPSVSGKQYITDSGEEVNLFRIDANTSITFGGDTYGADYWVMRSWVLGHTGEALFLTPGEADTVEISNTGMPVRVIDGIIVEIVDAETGEWRTLHEDEQIDVAPTATPMHEGPYAITPTPPAPTSEPSVAEEIVEQPTPEQADVPEVTPIPVVPYEHPPFPADLTELYKDSGHEIDHATAYYFVGKEGTPEVNITFPIIIGHGGFATFEGFPFQEANLTEAYVQALGEAMLHAYHRRYDVIMGNHISYEGFLNLVRENNGLVTFPHFREISPGQYEVVQGTLNLRDGIVLGQEVFNDLQYIDRQITYGFPHDIFPDNRTKALLHPSVNELGQPVIIIGFSAESFRQGLQYNNPKANMALIYKGNLSTMIAYLSNIDMLALDRTKLFTFEGSESVTNIIGHRALQAAWNYYGMPPEDFPDLPANLSFTSLPEEDRDALRMIFEREREEGFPYFISFVH